MVVVWKIFLGTIVVILAFDQAYKNIGYAVSSDGNLLEYGSFKLDNFFNKTIKRSFVEGLVKTLDMVYNPDMVVCEQVRLKNSFGININSIVALSELIAVIVDSVYPKNVYTIDSKSWKAKVVGKANATKEDTVEHVNNVYGLSNIDHDCADAICMSVYPNCKKPVLNIYE